MTVEFASPIRAKTNNMTVFVDQHYDEGVWIGLHSAHGSMHTILTKEEAEEMIRRLLLITEAL